MCYNGIIRKPDHYYLYIYGKMIHGKQTNKQTKIQLFPSPFNLSLFKIQLLESGYIKDFTKFLLHHYL